MNAWARWRRKHGGRTSAMCSVTSHGLGWLAALVLTVAGTGAPILASQFHVTTGGSSSGSGSLASPWSLSYAFSAPAAVHPGDTIWVHGGQYSFNAALDSYLSGTSNLPVIVRCPSGERATLTKTNPGNFVYIRGSNTWYWGLEVCYSTLDVVGQFGTPVFVYGVKNKLINCVVHDGIGTGIGDQSESQGTEIIGCLIYYNGRRPEGTHGYGIYGQNSTQGHGYKRYTDNIILNNFGEFQIHNYTEGSRIDSFLIMRNVIASSVNKATLLIGGGNPAPTGNVVDTNFFYGWKDPSWGFTGEFKEWGGHRNLRIRGNYFMQTGVDFSSATTGREFSGNTVYSYRPVFDDGARYVDTTSIPGNIFRVSEWPALPRRPTGTVVRFFRNKYDPSRAHVVVYNWDSLASVTVNLSTIVPAGREYRLLDAQNYYGAAVLQGAYPGGSITIPMTQSTIDPPVSAPSNVGMPVHLDRKFGVFILIADGAVVPPPEGTLSVTPDSVRYPGGNVRLAWSSLYASTANLTPGFGAVSTSGDTSIYVSSATTFNLALSGAGGTISLSKAVRLTTVAPPAPAIVSPAAGSVITADPIKLVWTRVSGVTGYHVQLSTDSTFATKLVIDSTLTDTSLHISALQEPKNHFMRVRARIEQAWSSFSPSTVFAVLPSKTAVDNGMEVPSSYLLLQNYPNPFNPSTTIEFQMARTGPAEIVVFDVRGALICTLVDDVRAAGRHRVQWGATGLASGSYFVYMNAGDFRAIRKILVVR